ncbi:bacillithiol biosynthesis cysteine-adding enzyme BshC [Oceanobacillus piezotolerans]|uniref:Putative cysteine ligase BshC n=2 Tax=Oceanobacillus piezotolerans TaxID=2448030 RepID=A0A498DBV3_9BACI|nr:bacillithiol biosynthesis cysteine-adding enzyme BshC [Oceanobacillus piezotolerans]
MRIDPVRLTNQSKLISDYRSNNKDIKDFFDYLPFDGFEERVNDLYKQSFQRTELADVLYQINKEWSAPASTLENINRLKESNSVVVVGGQQAGLLTGPLYTINKVISIIQLSKQQEEELNIPVIPVFWIAGEDHDFDEINHIYLRNSNEMKKWKVSQQNEQKSSVSHIEMDKEEVKNWLNRIFIELQETAYTKELHEVTEACLSQSNTYTEFFARLIFRLFDEYGLVLVDSAHPLIRNLESSFFLQMIENQQKITNEVRSTLKRLGEKSYTVPLDVEENAANLFYHKGQERILLMRDENGDWVGKQQEVKFTTEEIIQIAKDHPEQLSNNVVTRPLMQELIFPTLAFIGGPGEISYWAGLKTAFHTLGVKMPPVVPRLSFTFLDSTTNKGLEKYKITVDEAINEGLNEFKEEWIKSKSNPPIEDLAADLKKAIEKAHAPLRKVASDIRSDIRDLSEKNLTYLMRDVEFLEKRMNKAVEEKYAKELNDLKGIQLALRPAGLQERIWNPLPLINQYGVAFVHQTIHAPCSFMEDHYVVHI